MPAGRLARALGAALTLPPGQQGIGISGEQNETQQARGHFVSKKEDAKEEGDKEDREEEGDRRRKAIESESERKQRHQRVNAGHQSKLAGETTTNQASFRRAAQGDDARHSDGDSEAHQQRQQQAKQQQKQQQRVTKANTSTKRVGKKLGLLEALLGERGRSWLENRTLALDVQSEQQKRAQPVGSKSDENLSTKRAGELTEADSYRKLDEDKRQDRLELIASGKAASERRETRLRKYSRLPTFGSIPQRLSTQTVQKAGRNSVASSRLSDSSSSSASSDSSSDSSSSASSKAPPQPQPQPRPISRGQPSEAGAAQRRETSATNWSALRRSPQGYSNISNLFPGRPVTRRQRHGEPAQERSQKSLSLSNLAEERIYARPQHQPEQPLAGARSPAAAAAEKARQRQRRIAQQHQPARPASAMMRQRTGQQHSAASAQRNSKANNYPDYQQRQRQQQRLRPASATGNYLSGGGGVRARARSPSASYRLGSAGMSPLVDPDCPVHGEQLAAGQRGRSYERDKRDDFFERARYADYAPGQPAAGGYFSSSQPDLVYAPEEDPYNIARPARDYPAYGPERTPPYAKGSPVYSPLSPIDYGDTAPAYGGRAGSRASRRPMSSGGGGGQQQQPAAYYNEASRFSLYHAAPDGGGVRSALAPTSEQLRRILGYRPQPPAKPVHLHPQWAYTRPFIHLQPAGRGFGRAPTPLLGEHGEPLESDEVLKFAPFNRLQDSQAVRAVDFHPSGEVYAIGSNSRALRICAYPAEHELRHFEPWEPWEPLEAWERDEQLGEPAARQRAPKSPRVLFKFLQLHRGSIYCVGFNPGGQLLATGSNDQTVHIAKYNSVTHNPDGEEFRLTMHNGTVRDLCFIDDSSGGSSSLLLSAGGGDNKIYVTDCDTITPFQSMAGHTQMVMALSHCAGAQFVSGSHDKTIRFWDLRARSCTSIVSAPPASASAGSPTAAGLSSGPGAPVCALRVDPSGRLLASGHTDSTCMLYDIRGGKIIQTFRPHDDEIRAISFSPKSYYLLTGGYDGRLVVSDLQGDLTQPLPSVCVAESQDKIVQAKWHPADFTFVSTSADKSATLWSLPGEIRN